jgi:hypothetical protein
VKEKNPVNYYHMMLRRVEETRPKITHQAVDEYIKTMADLSNNLMGFEIEHVRCELLCEDWNEVKITTVCYGEKTFFMNAFDELCEKDAHFMAVALDCLSDKQDMLKHIGYVHRVFGDLPHDVMRDYTGFVPVWSCFFLEGVFDISSPLHVKVAYEMLKKNGNRDALKMLEQLLDGKLIQNEG